MPLPAFLDISTGELLVILVAVFIVLGPKKVPEVARQIGKGMNELRKVTHDLTKEFKEGVNQVKEDVDVLKPDAYGNVPYKPDEQVAETTPPITNARSFSHTLYNEIHSNTSNPDAGIELKPADQDSKPTEEPMKSGEKGLLF